MKNKNENITDMDLNEKTEVKKKKRRPLDKIITAVLILVIIVCIVNIVLILGRYKKANKEYDDIRSKFLLPVDDGTETSSDGSTDNSKDMTAAPPDDVFSVDFDALLDYNSDIVGWIYSENTPISYPVVQTTDNKFYVRRGLEKQYLITGTIFADYRCGNVGEDENYVIYGHHMRNGTIFGSLEKYVTQEYYDAHPTFIYYTPDKAYNVEIFAGYVDDVSSQFFKPSFYEGERERLISEAREKSGFVSNVEVGEDDEIMTFATCSYQFEDARFVLLGKISERQ